MGSPRQQLFGPIKNGINGTIVYIPIMQRSAAYNISIVGKVTDYCVSAPTESVYPVCHGQPGYLLEMAHITGDQGCAVS